jgi:hypothetical protein
VSAAWVAGSVRAKAMTRRRLGRAAVRALAESTSSAEALVTLSRGPYRDNVRADQTVGAAQRGVVEAVLWNVRVLAGWLPREGAAMLRALVAAVEIANVHDHLLRLGGVDTPAPYRLGGLATAWSRLAGTSSPEEVRQVLATSPWGDPQASTPGDIVVTMRTVLADRVISAVPWSLPWSAGAVALQVARELFVNERPLPRHAALTAARVIGSKPMSTGTLTDFVDALPATARWALAEVGDASRLWHAEAGWWARVERDAMAMTRRSAPGPEVPVGAVAMMAVDAWRVRAALEVAARGGNPAGAFDAVA